MCIIENCDGKVVGWGFCTKHYQRWKKWGDPYYTKIVYHNYTGTPAHNSWMSMLDRCYYPNHTHFNHYGGRGITVCERWKESFLNFLEDMGERPRGTVLDRVDTDGNYEPSNCRWVDWKTQNNNRSLFQTNKTGVSGVSWSSSKQKWRVNISRNGKCIDVGCFSDFEEAVNAREKANKNKYKFS